MRTRLKHAYLQLLAAILTIGLSTCAGTASAQELSQNVLQPYWQQLETVDWIAQGPVKPRHVLYEFVDPNCGYCHQLWSEMQAEYSHGVQVRYILLGIISDSSPYKAAAILEAADPAAALRRNERLWGQNPDGSKGGGIQPLASLDFSMRLKLMMHFKLAQNFGILGTPGLVWKDRQGQIHVRQSAPSPEELQRIVESASSE
ncbi:MAG TPA: thioredoxin fold domain-containing protein [Gammaproteobacteria bacterium]|jgi:thiol:disulfide interchange protein DsbG|nr:thioredoxin fold domain-containing protein [Gammaproteobacteria bacterium]